MGTTRSLAWAVLLASGCLEPLPEDRDGLAETYGADDRREVSATSNPVAVQWARSAVTFIPLDRMRELGPVVRLDTQGRSLRQMETLCATEQFVNQPMMGTCSGFLVGPDLVVTAGHCFRTSNICQTHAIVFRYAIETIGADPVTGAPIDSDPLIIPAEEVYRCAPATADAPNPVAQFYRRKKKDFAVVRLDRAVPPATVAADGTRHGHDPLPLRRDRRVAVGEHLTVIGNPSGIPLKIDEGVSVVAAPSTEKSFTTTADTFERNSGSMVVDDEGLVVGLNIEGARDYTVGVPGECRRAIVCGAVTPTGGSCQGSTELHVGDVLQYVPPLPVVTASPTTGGAEPDPSAVPSEPLPE